MRTCGVLSTRSEPALHGSPHAAVLPDDSVPIGPGGGYVTPLRCSQAEPMVELLRPFACQPLWVRTHRRNYNVQFCATGSATHCGHFWLAVDDGVRYALHQGVVTRTVAGSLQRRKTPDGSATVALPLIGCPSSDTSLELGMSWRRVPRLRHLSRECAMPIRLAPIGVLSSLGQDSAAAFAGDALARSRYQGRLNLCRPQMFAADVTLLTTARRWQSARHSVCVRGDGSSCHWVSTG